MHRTLLFFTAILLSACHQRNTVAPIWKVEVATSECFGTCQNTLTVIDSNLNYHFYGGRVAKGGAIGRKGKIFGFYTAKVSRRFWDSLTTRLEDNDYRSLDTGYHEENDAQFLEIRVHYGKQVKRIHGYDIDMPDGIVKTIKWVAHSYITIRPVATKDTIKSDIKYLGDWER
jgi:hypothetical protein